MVSELSFTQGPGLTNISTAIQSNLTFGSSATILSGANTALISLFIEFIYHPSTTSVDLKCLSIKGTVFYDKEGSKGVIR